MSSESAIAGAMKAARAVWVKQHAHQIATIQRRNSKKDKVSSNVVDHKPLREQVKCKVVTNTNPAQVDQGDDMTVSVISFFIRFPYGTDIKADDQIDVDGQRYSIVGQPDTGRANALYVQVSVVKK